MNKGGRRRVSIHLIATSLPIIRFVRDHTVGTWPWTEGDWRTAPTTIAHWVIMDGSGRWNIALLSLLGKIVFASGSGVLVNGLPAFEAFLFSLAPQRLVRSSYIILEQIGIGNYKTCCGRYLVPWIVGIFFDFHVHVITVLTRLVEEPWRNKHPEATKAHSKKQLSKAFALTSTSFFGTIKLFLWSEGFSLEEEA